jgi:hypothetical protein
MSYLAVETNDTGGKRGNKAGTGGKKRRTRVMSEKTCQNYLWRMFAKSSNPSVEEYEDIANKVNQTVEWVQV